MAKHSFGKLLLGQAGGTAVIVVLAVVCVYLFGVRGMRFFEVPSGSMRPTLLEGDHLVTLKQRDYARGDVVVIDTPDGYIVKRIVAQGGDQAMVVDGALFVNEVYASEPYIAEPMEYMLEPTRVPEGHVFVLGDNRNVSYDTHLSKETYAQQAIVGRVRFRYYPYSRWGAVPSFPLRAVLVE
ncbi:MAG: signal peptidase I [Candidatus Hydrogenedentota bacterium]